MTVKELKQALEGVPEAYELDVPLEFKVEIETVVVLAHRIWVAKLIESWEAVGVELKAMQTIIDSLPPE